MYDDELACAIARLHFGDVVGSIVRLLLQHPGLSLSDVYRRSGDYGGRTVRDALCVLISHGAASASANALGEVTYLVEPATLLARLRFPLYLGLAQRRFGELGRVVLEALFSRGRLTAKHMFSIALDRPMQELGISDDAATQCLIDMAHSGMLRWTGSRARGEGALCGGRKRPREEEGEASEDEEGKEGLASGKKIRVGFGFNSRIVGTPFRSNDDDVWTVSFWFLNRCFRNEACKIVVANRVVDAFAVEVFITGLNIALAREDAEGPTDDLETCEISTEAVHQELKNNNHEISGRDFWTAIRVLVALNPPCVKAIPEQAPTKLKFVPGRLVAEVRQQSLEDMIVQRYKKTGRRIFRALAIDGCMEDKMIAEKCMLDIKVVREKLFCMHRDKLVTMQEVPRSHEMMRANNWYYLWRVKPHEAYNCFLDIMYKTQTNLLLKMEALNKHVVNGEDKKAAKLRKAQKSLLTASVIRVDQSIMVMRDFGPLTAAFFPARYRITEASGRRVARIR